MIDTAMAAADHTGGAHHPTDHDLIALVLRPMAAAAAAAAGNQGFDFVVGGGGFVHVADVYSVAPERLAERYAPAAGSSYWYFLCPARRRHRTAAAGALGQRCWASAETGGAVRPVTGPDGRRVGQARVLAYGAGTAAPWAAVTTRGWSMVELALDDGHDGGGDFVLCKLFRSSATAAVAATAVPAIVSSCKRKAAVDEHPEAPPCVRQQLMQRSF